MRRALPLALCFAGFASLGLPDGVLGVAWPSLRASFGLPVDALGVLLVAATGGYVASSFASGAVLARLSLGSLLALSSVATALALAGYAGAPSWALLVPWGVVAGMGAGAIDAGINGFAARTYSPRVVTWMHASYGLGTTAGPLAMTQLLMAGHGWRAGYALVASAQLALGLCFAATRGIWGAAADAEPAAGARDAGARAGALATLRAPSVALGVAVFLVYTGIEAAAGAWTYSLLHEARGVEMGAAGRGASLFWAGLLAGRAGFGAFGARFAPAFVLRAATLGIALGAAALAFGDTGALAFAGALGLGLACAPVFPLLIAGTPARVGAAHTANAIGFQIAAAGAGQAGVPALLGLLAAAHGLEASARALVALAAVLIALMALLLAARAERPATSAAEALRNVGV